MTQALRANPYQDMGIGELSREHIKLGSSLLSLDIPSWRRRFTSSPLVSYIPLHLQDELLLLGVRFKELLIGEGHYAQLHSAYRQTQPIETAAGIDLYFSDRKPEVEIRYCNCNYMNLYCSIGVGDRYIGVGSIRSVFEHLPRAIELLHRGVECMGCYYGDKSGEYCGKGLVGDGNCNHYREGAIE